MILRIIAVSLRSLSRRPFHTFLVLQGVVWGTALGVFPPAVINGSLKHVEAQASRLGTDRLVLTQDHVEAAQQFDWGLVERLRREHGDMVLHATGMAVMGSPVQLAASGITARCSVIATDERALGARGLKLARGRFFTAGDLGAGRAVCVLEHRAAALWGSADPIGETLQVGDGPVLEVIGVTAPRDAEGEVLDELGYQRNHPMRKLVDQMKQYVGVFDDLALEVLRSDHAVMVPYTLLGSPAPRWIELRAHPKDVLRLREQLQNQLVAEGYEPVIYANAVLPVLYGETIKTAVELNRAVFVLCILVGTAVVCSIMVLSVVERQREIAIRRVEGARRWHIALQFVIETGTICAVGGVFGVPLGIALAIIRCALEPLGSVSWTFPIVEVWVLLGVVTAIGLAGGMLPAWRAMRVDPVEMLRYE